MQKRKPGRGSVSRSLADRQLRAAIARGIFEETGV